MGLECMSPDTGPWMSAVLSLCNQWDLGWSPPVVHPIYVYYKAQMATLIIQVGVKL